MSDKKPQFAIAPPDADAAPSVAFDTTGRTRTLTTEARAMNSSSYANYLFGGAGAGEVPAWSDSTAGRAAIRVLSRGIVGTAFFTIGGRFAKQSLQNYHIEKELKWGKETPVLQHLARGFDNTLGKMFQGVGYALADVSKAQEMVREGKTLAQAKLRLRRMAAYNITDFRQKAYYHDTPGQVYEKTFKDGMKLRLPYNGRSYGAEVVGVTFDFAMASVGDALTRNLIQGIDPHVKHTWMLDKDGKPTTRAQGQFHFGNWVKAVGEAGWRIISKNQGEDWAAGIVYVFQMKYQRQALNRVFKGSKLVFDNGWNGAALKVNEQGQVIGDYMLPGAIDLHLRFGGYNWYTLMFREGYEAIGDHLLHWRKHERPLVPSIPANPVAATVNGAAHATRYVAKSFIKSQLYMQPILPLFWLTRVPQSLWRGGYVHEVEGNALKPMENALLSKESFNGYLHHSAKDKSPAGIAAMRSNMQFHDPFANTYDLNYPTTHARTPIMAGVHFDAKHPFNQMYFDNRVAPTIAPRTNYSPSRFDHYQTDTPLQRVEKSFSRVLNPFGAVCYWTGTKATRAADKVLGGAINKDSLRGRVAKFVSRYPGFDQGRTGDIGREAFVRTGVDAFFSYTPYMWGKAETALRVDEHKPNQPGQMDKAIYRLIDNTVALNPTGMITAGRDMVKLGFHFDKSVKSREGEIIHHDTPATVVDAASVKTQGTQTPQGPGANDNGQEANDNERNWAETVTGRQLGAQFQSPAQHRH